MLSRIALSLVALTLAPGIADAQAPKPKFEVASITRCINPSVGGEGEGRGPTPDTLDRVGRMTISCWSLSALIQSAYIVFAGGRFNGNHYPVAIDQLPAWAKSETYTIEAKADGSPGQSVMRGPMLQTLLEDRFALKIRSMLRNEPAYTLTVGKSGFKLPPFKGGCTPLNPIYPPESPVPFKELCHAAPGDVVMNLDIVARFLGRLKTLDALLKPSADGDSAPSVFTVVKDFGLKLQAIKAPRRYLVVDRVQRPSEN